MIVAVDIGGTKTLVASFANGLHATNEERFPTPQNEHEFMSMLNATLQNFATETAEAICVAVPGIVDADGVVLRCGNLPWQNFPLRTRLAENFSCPIYINNDANLAGLAETHSLPSVPALSVYVTVSTGIGTGIITNGRLLQSLAGSEGGHMLLQTPTGFQEWEDFASGKAIYESHGKLARDIHDTEEWHRIAEDLALGFQALIPLLQPDIIIIGGSVGRYFDQFGHLLSETLKSRMPAFIPIPPIVQAKHPDEAVVYGCYHYATHQAPTEATN